MLTIYFLVAVSIGTLILLACYCFLNKKAVGDLGLENLNIAISLKRILKNLLLVVILIAVGYGALSETDLDGKTRRNGKVLDIGCYRAPDTATFFMVQ